MYHVHAVPVEARRERASDAPRIEVTDGLGSLELLCRSLKDMQTAEQAPLPDDCQVWNTNKNHLDLLATLHQSFPTLPILPGTWPEVLTISSRHLRLFSQGDFPQVCSQGVFATLNIPRDSFLNAQG